MLSWHNTYLQFSLLMSTALMYGPTLYFLKRICPLMFRYIQGDPKLIHYQYSILFILFSVYLYWYSLKLYTVKIKSTLRSFFANFIILLQLDLTIVKYKFSYETCLWSSIFLFLIIASLIFSQSHFRYNYWDLICWELE